MKNTLIFFVVLICLCAPAFGLTCSNDKIQASGAFMNDKITCDSITDFEVSPELAFLTVRQSVNSIHVSGNITGREVTGYIRIYGQISASSGAFDTRDSIRVPVIINAGSTPPQTVTPTLTIQTTIPTKPTYAPIPAVIIISSIAGAALLWKRKS
jgi:hypothetical protein